MIGEPLGSLLRGFPPPASGELPSGFFLLSAENQRFEAEKAKAPPKTLEFLQNIRFRRIGRFCRLGYAEFQTR